MFFLIVMLISCAQTAKRNNRDIPKPDTEKPVESNREAERAIDLTEANIDAETYIANLSRAEQELFTKYGGKVQVIGGELEVVYQNLESTGSPSSSPSRAYGEEFSDMGLTGESSYEEIPESPYDSATIVAVNRMDSMTSGWQYKIHAPAEEQNKLQSLAAQLKSALYGRLKNK